MTIQAKFGLQMETMYYSLALLKKPLLPEKSNFGVTGRAGGLPERIIFRTGLIFFKSKKS
jgi:hypothetical protein